MNRTRRATWTLGLFCAAIVILAPAAFASPALVSIEEPEIGTAGELLADGITVVRDLERYLLATVEPEGESRLESRGLRYRVLAPTIEGRTFYTVTARTTAFVEASPGVRLLRFDGYDAVIEASPADAEKVAEAGFEIARVFLRPIRVVDRDPPQRLSGLRAGDPAIQALVNDVSTTAIDASVQRLQNFVTRYAAHDSCQAAANWIKAEFESFGIDSVFFHSFHPAYKDNVVAVIPGKGNPAKQVVIGGHYDSITSDHNNCPGADDDASGTACVIECARVLAGTDFDYTLVFIAFGGEELGLYGSEGYAADAAARGDDIIGMVAVDMIGYVAGGDAIDLDIVDNASSDWLRDLIMSTAADYVPELTVVDGSLPGGASSDHASFWAHGYDAILFFEDTGNYSPYIHTTSDVVGVSYNNPTLALRSVKAAVGLIATMARPFTISITHDPLPDTEDTSNPYRVAATIVSASPLEPDSLLVRYATGGPATAVTMTPTVTPDEYEAYIPAQSGGTFVDYWLIAGDTVGNRVTDPEGAPASSHRFFVGTITAAVTDEFETESGWTAGAPGDGATTGSWERGDPHGTYSGSILVQPEDDHTAAPGIRCWVTGNAAGAGHGDDDVDNGKTTLLSPIYDLSSYTNASVRYYRWYTNDTGAGPETDDWVVDISTNGGGSWSNVETLGSSDRSWTLVEWDIGANVDLTSQMQFRFIATDDSPGSIVEAGVDDFSIVVYQEGTTPAPWPLAAAEHLLLHPARPNPFTDRTALRFRVPEPGRPVSLSIYGVGGRRLARLLNGVPMVGEQVVWWDGRDHRGQRVASGIYWVRLETEDGTRSRKVTLLR
jgi:hypothetical protein